MAVFLSVSHREKQFCALSVSFIFVLALVRSASAQSECSLSKTNKNCTLTIDRSNPVAPSTVQMYSDQHLTVVIKNPLPFERYFLDFSSGQATIAPDVTANIVTALSGNLGKFGNFIQSHEYGLAVEKAKARSANALDDCYAKNFTDKKWPATGDVLTEQQQFNTCFGALAGYAIPTYHDLEPMVAPDALTSAPLTSRTIAYLTTQADVQGRINTYLAAETAISNSITALTKLSGATTPSPYTPDEQLYIAELGVYQKIIDAVSADLAGYEQRIKDIGPCGYVDPNSGPSHNPYCWDKTSQTYSQGNLALWKDKFYLRTGNKACTSSGADPRVMIRIKLPPSGSRSLQATSNLSAILIKSRAIRPAIKLSIARFGGLVSEAAFPRPSRALRPGSTVQSDKISRCLQSQSSPELTINACIRTWSRGRSPIHWTL